MSEASRFLVTGAPRSGTTFLQQMLNTHPKIVCLHEFGIEKFIDGFDGLFSQPLNQPLQNSCRDVNSRQARMAARRKMILEHTNSLRPYPNAELHRTQIEQAFFRIVGQKADADVFGDKVPNIGRQRLELLRVKNPRLKALHVIRRPRDVIASSLARQKAACAGQDCWHIRTFEEALEEWKRNIETAYYCLDAFPDLTLIVKYEDFRDSMHLQGGRIGAFLKLENEFKDVFDSIEPEWPAICAEIQARVEYTNFAGLDDKWNNISLDQIKHFLNGL